MVPSRVTVTDVVLVTTPAVATLVAGVAGAAADEGVAGLGMVDDDVGDDAPPLIATLNGAAGAGGVSAGDDDDDDVDDDDINDALLDEVVRIKLVRAGRACIVGR